MKAKRLILPALLISATALTGKADIVINEVMQSNVYGIMDDLNDFPDSWVELYNTGDETVNLEGYRIAVKDKFKKAYKLDGLSIPAGGYLLLYCDKAEQGRHTDFRIDSGKGDIFLYDPDGNIIEQLTLKKQPAPDVAYGRESDGADKWGYELTPTPGEANGGGLSKTVLEPVVFSVPGGVWHGNQHITLELQLPESAPEGAQIYYTTNGSEPTKDNATVYNGEICINKSTVVRAKVVADGCISIPSNAQSYIYMDRDMKIPVISFAINNEYLYDTKIGIFSEGENPPMWGDNPNANYFQDWRRPCNVEYFESEGTPSEINQLCETRVQGGYTRRNALKSMAVYANKRFGVKRFEYEFWQKDKPGITDNKSFILRNGGNDFSICYVRDGLMQRIIGRNTSNIDWQGYAPAIIFINGEYHAMLAIRERSSEDNISANYEGLEDIDMFENWDELKAGDEAALDEFKDFIATEHTWDEWCAYINVESFTNLMALNYWIYNTDFPHNNTVMWRRTDGVDGRWQWLVKDCDFGLGIYSQNDVNSDFAKWLNNNPEHYTPTCGYDLWKQLMKCPEFKAYFIDHLVVYMGDFLNAKTFNAYTDEIVNENQGEQLISHNKWAGNMWWTPDLNGNINSMRDWINKRQNNMKNIMKNGWSLGNPVSVKVNTGLTDTQIEGINVYYDGIGLTQGVFEGYDYVGRTIVLSGDEESNIKGWTVKVGSAAVQTFDTPTLEYAISGSSAIVINAIINEGGVSDITVDTNRRFTQDGNVIYGKGLLNLYDMAGRHIADGYGSVTIPVHGAYIVKSTDGASTKVFW